MTARSGQWELLSQPMRPVDGDPLPTDPSDIWDEGDGYVAIAAEIREQRDRLRHLAGTDSGLKGLYADELTKGMADLADDLDKSDERFDKVGKLIRDDFYEAYSTARSRTLSALNDAEEAHGRAAANEPDEGGSSTPAAESGEPDPEAEARQGRYEAANGDLLQARRDFAGAMGDFHSTAEDIADKIKKASDDDMKDGFWDKVGAVIDSIAPVLKIIKWVLGAIAIVLLVVGIFFTGGLLLVAIGAVLAVAQLAISTMLAASGNGSWTDVALDAVGVLTLGIGTKAIAVAKAGRMATLTRAAAVSERAARSTAFTRTAWNGGRGLRGVLSAFRPSVWRAMDNAGDAARLRVLNRAIPDVGAPSQWFLRGGIVDRSVAELSRDFTAIARDFPGITVSGANALKVADISTKTGLAVGVVQGVDTVAQGAGGVN